MADNVTFQTTVATPPDGTVVATDQVGGSSGPHYQLMKLADGTADSSTVVAAGNGVAANALRVTLASDGTGVVAATQSGTWNVGTVTSITNPVTVDSELTTADLDTGAGTDTRAVVGLVGAKSGGGALIPGDATAGLKVDLGADNDVTVTGSVTANAGTNLNTSALALESGGNLAGAAASLAVIDDWDESDRAKVNPIVGQAGVAAGAGAVGVTTQRVTLASDDPAVASLSVLDDWDSNDRAKVSPISGQDGVAGGSGVVGATTQRVTLATDVALPAGTNNIGDVDVLTVPAPLSTTGNGTAATALRVTVASDSTGTIAATQSGTWNVGTVTPGSAAANLGKAEDAAHASGDVGVMALAVRSDAQAVTAADGDYVPLLVNSAGALYVTGGGGGTQYVEDAAAAADPTGTAPILVRKDTPAATVSTDGDNIAQRGSNFGAAYVTLLDSSGAFVNPGGGTQYDEDAASAGAEKLTLAGAVRRDTAASSSGTDGDYSTLNTDASGRLWVNASGAAVPVTDNGGSLTVDGTIAVTSLPGTKIEDTASADSDIGMAVMAVRKATPANTSGTDGDYEMLQMSAGRLWASATIDAALPAGTNAIGKLAANSGVDIGDVDVTSIIAGTGATNLGKAEDAAHTSGDTGVMALAVRRDVAASGTSTDGDYATLNVDGNGRLYCNIDDGNIITIEGANASDAAVTGGLIRNGGRASTDTPSAVSADGDSVDVWLNRSGATAVFPVAHSAGGCAPYKNLDVDESEDQVIGSATQLYWIHAMNLASSKRYLKIYNNTAAGVTVGTTVPDLTFPLPTMADTNGAGFTVGFPVPIELGTGLTVAATTGFADNDSGAPGANEVIVNLGYAA